MNTARAIEVLLSSKDLAEFARFAEPNKNCTHGEALGLLCQILFFLFHLKGGIHYIIEEMKLQQGEASFELTKLSHIILLFFMTSFDDKNTDEIYRFTTPDSMYLATQDIINYLDILHPNHELVLKRCRKKRSEDHAKHTVFFSSDSAAEKRMQAAVQALDFFRSYSNVIPSFYYDPHTVAGYSFTEKGELQQTEFTSTEHLTYMALLLRANRTVSIDELYRLYGYSSENIPEVQANNVYVNISTLKRKLKQTNIDADNYIFSIENNGYALITFEDQRNLLKERHFYLSKNFLFFPNLGAILNIDERRVLPLTKIQQELLHYIFLLKKNHFTYEELRTQLQAKNNTAIYRLIRNLKKKLNAFDQSLDRTITVDNKTRQYIFDFSS